ncbi:methyltransferase domain-containing protein [Microbispora sp. RL4-1S]|uniref:Methyltransferase domain-containing protein n=1 Tax=Microbispora oryzae TaxID=2806554 RepID=A0A940WIU2_9ACTN|nr:methyltransferase domain-containing protein [Microbispora oryzae]MBP2702360.1 methyltransferase domain-containing protein [Microbispora oryzae]
MGDATRQAVVWAALRAALAGRSAVTGRVSLDIVDAGGGTGGFAVPLAKLGHAVTVVDPTPDSLAALERRAAETGVGVKGLQGDAADLARLLPPGSADLVLCHSVLEYVEDPAGALGAVAGILRPGGAVSVLAANSVAVAVHRSLAGRFDEAGRVLSDPAGRWGDRDPTPRRFSRETLTALLSREGFTPGEVHGVRIFAGLVPGMLAESDPEGLAALEQAAAAHPVLRDIATQIHVIAHR